jgi:hypothetical protein
MLIVGISLGLSAQITLISSLEDMCTTINFFYEMDNELRKDVARLFKMSAQLSAMVSGNMKIGRKSNSKLLSGLHWFLSRIWPLPQAIASLATIS